MKRKERVVIDSRLYILPVGSIDLISSLDNDREAAAVILEIIKREHRPHDIIDATYDTTRL